MAAKPTKKPKTKTKQSERFIETARRLDADESGAAFEKAFKKITPSKNRSRKMTKIIAALLFLFVISGPANAQQYDPYAGAHDLLQQQQQAGMQQQQQQQNYEAMQLQAQQNQIMQQQLQAQQQMLQQQQQQQQTQDMYNRRFNY